MFCGGRGTLTILGVLLELVPEAVAGQGGRGWMLWGNLGQGASQRLARGEQSLREGFSSKEQKAPG